MGGIVGLNYTCIILKIWRKTSSNHSISYISCWYYVLLHTSQSKSSSSMQIPVTVFCPGVTVGGRVLLIVIFLKHKQKVIQLCGPESALVQHCVLDTPAVTGKAGARSFSSTNCCFLIKSKTGRLARTARESSQSPPLHDWNIPITA